MNNIELYIWEAQPAQAEFFKQRKEKEKKKKHTQNPDTQSSTIANQSKEKMIKHLEKKGHIVYKFTSNICTADFSEQWERLILEKIQKKTYYTGINSSTLWI